MYTQTYSTCTFSSLPYTKYNIAQHKIWPKYYTVEHRARRSDRVDGKYDLTYAHTHTHTHMHTHTHTPLHTHMHKRTHTHTLTHIHTHTLTGTCTHTYTRTHRHIHLCGKNAVLKGMKWPNMAALDSLNIVLFPAPTLFHEEKLPSGVTIVFIFCSAKQEVNSNAGAFTRAKTHAKKLQPPKTRN